MKLRPIPLGAALVCLLAPPVQAQTPSLKPVTVSASPVIEGNATDTFAGFRTEVTDRQIQDLNAVDLAAALRRTPGVTISRFNPVGSYGGEEGGAVYIRGLGASRPGSEIKTYVDGIPFYMGVWNHPLLDLLPVNGMGSVSVLKGPQPSEVGNTFGAINLVPKRAAKGQGLQLDAQIAAGSFSTLVEQVDLTGRSGDWDFALAQGHARSDGHRPGADGKLNNIMANVGYRFSGQWSANVLLLHAENKAGDPGNATTGAGQGDRFDTRGTLMAVGIDHDHGMAKGSLRVYSNDGQSVQQPGLTTRFKLSGARWRETLKPWAGGEVVAGLDFERIAGEVSPVGFTGTDMKLTSPYAAVGHTVALGQGWTVTPSAGVRAYRHNELGSATAPHAGLVVNSADQWSFRAQVSRGVNYPGLDAQVLGHLIPALGTTWKTLGAEKLDHKELGLSWTPSARTTLDVSVFHDRLSGRYVFAFPPAVTSPTFLNLGEYSVKGAELSLQQELAAGWNAFVGATHLSASKADLPYAPSNSLTLGINGQVGAWRLGMDAQRQSSMFVLAQGRAGDAANVSQVAGFTVVNARVAYKVPALGARGEVFVAAENLLDRQYEFRPGYPMAGRSVQVGLHASF